MTFIEDDEPGGDHEQPEEHHSGETDYLGDASPRASPAQTPAAETEEVKALDITGSVPCRPMEDASGSIPGGDLFARASESLAQLERDFHAREADLAAREAALAEAKEAFQEAVREASTLHKAQEAIISMKTR